MNRLIAACLALIAAAPAAAREDAPPLNYEAAVDALGVWTLSVEPPEDAGPDDRRHCTLEFLASETDGRFDLALDPACAATFPALAGAATWTAHDSGATAFDKAGIRRMSFVHRGPNWMLASMIDDPARYTLNQVTPRGVRAVAGVYDLASAPDVPYVSCSVTLAMWHAPIVKGASRVAYGLQQAADCNGTILGEAVGWRALPDPRGGWLIAILSADQRELGRFQESEGWETALSGTLHGKPFLLNRKRN